MFKKIPYLHIILFVITFLSTMTAGALQQGVNIIEQPRGIFEGLPFAVSLMAILLFHEFSHYIASKKHRTNATLPYFIPAPSLIGTFGAFIKMKSPIITRRALIDIGASGPIAGFIIAVIACIIGLSLSSIDSIPPEQGFLTLGESILFSLLAKIILGTPPENYSIILHPVAFAGWIGLFVTSLNLIPVGQLDGGHILYAVIGGRHRQTSIFFIGVLIILGIFLWMGWLVWAALLLILGVKHPPVIYWEIPLDKKRSIASLCTLIIFIITFIPEPFRLMN